MNSIIKNRSISSKITHPADRPAAPPRPGTLTRRELRRIVADLIG